MLWIALLLVMVWVILLTFFLLLANEALLLLRCVSLSIGEANSWFGCCQRQMGSLLVSPLVLPDQRKQGYSMGKQSKGQRGLSA